LWLNFVENICTALAVPVDAFSLWELVKFWLLDVRKTRSPSCCVLSCRSAYQCLGWLPIARKSSCSIAGLERGLFLGVTKGLRFSPLTWVVGYVWNLCRLPTAHTCFNVLMLPDYSYKSWNWLKLAIANSTGLGYSRQLSFCHILSMLICDNFVWMSLFSLWGLQNCLLCWRCTRLNQDVASASNKYGLSMWRCW
jgi:hypothetical protein